MKEVHPRIFRNADTLRPSDLRASLEHIENQMDDLERRRWVHSCFTLDWRDLQTDDGSNEGVFKVQPPSALGDWEIVALEWRVAAAANDYTLTIADDGTTIETLSITSTGATAFVAETKATSHVIQSGSELVFTLTGYASDVAVANAQLTVHIRSDRHQGSLPASRAFNRPDIIDGAPVDGSELKAYLDGWDTDVTAHNTNKTALRIEVLQVRNVTGTDPSAHDFVIPATGSKLHSFGAYLLQGGGSGTEECLFRVTDTDAATNYDVTVTAAGVNTFADNITAGSGTSVAATQSNDDPDDTNDHWTATIDAAGTSTNVKRAFMVLYWQE